MPKNSVLHHDYYPQSPSRPPAWRQQIPSPQSGRLDLRNGSRDFNPPFGSGWYVLPRQKSRHRIVLKAGRFVSRISDHPIITPPASWGTPDRRLPLCPWDPRPPTSINRPSSCHPVNASDPGARSPASLLATISIPVHLLNGFFEFSSGF